MITILLLFGVSLLFAFTFLDVNGGAIGAIIDMVNRWIE